MLTTTTTLAPHPHVIMFVFPHLRIATMLNVRCKVSKFLLGTIYGIDWERKAEEAELVGIDSLECEYQDSIVYIY